ncbi:hypothetical protein [Paenibacillus mendelii]|uniref:Uncharacterized protein n=1 Tax=Paenibacillus mendelii TaxID=206163 RepID=A0ABV6JE73_9BACL|nr:hypothetical protein [Paenibacillus mendelii]MCQ6563340.1 hypothetical protein [Paenibacillus mendelii]
MLEAILKTIGKGKRIDAYCVLDNELEFALVADMEVLRRNGNIDVLFESVRQ